MIMAGIDKLRTSNYVDYNKFRLWCIKNNLELLNNFYEPFLSCVEWEEIQKIQWEHFKDAPSYFETELAVASFFSDTDRYLYWHCPLEFVREYLETQCGFKKANWFVKLFWKY
jgi:hypothetical protein